MGREIRHGDPETADYQLKVAVSGASGFVGRHVVAELERRDISPTLWIRASSTYPESWTRHRVVRLDLSQPSDESFESLGCPDVLIHLAWGGLPNYRSLHHFEDELPRQYRMLKRLIQSGLAGLVVTGTCFEYGLQSGPLHEGLRAAPDNPYGIAKDMLRIQLEQLQGSQPFLMTWARLFYLHGDGQSSGALYSQLKRAASVGEARFPMSGGEQLRDYLAIEEAAQRLVDLAATGRNNGTVNVCSGRPVSVRKLVEGWIEERRWAIEPDLGRYPYPDHEPMAFWGDATKLNQCLEMS